MPAQVFAIKNTSPARLDEEHVKRKIRNDDYTFRDCVENPAIMHHFVAKQIRCGDPETGYPVKAKDEKVPNYVEAIYECSKSRVFERHATKPHPELQFLRKASVTAAVDALKDKCMYPIGCKACDTPDNEPWNNYAQCLYNFYAEYCFREGLSRTSDLSRAVLLFIFYGHFEWNYKRKRASFSRVKSVLFWLQKKVSQGRSRFAKGAERYFKKFARLVKKNKWEKFLEDGEGNPPVEYLAAVEEGLRAYSEDIYTMGSHVLRSPQHWKRVRKWRKREAFIAIMRVLCDYMSYYKQWDCFAFNDYVFRQEMERIFDLRHYPLSDGKDELHFKGVLDFNWSEHAFEPQRKRQNTQSNDGNAVPAKKSKTTKSKPRIFDLTTGDFREW